MSNGNRFTETAALELLPAVASKSIEGGEDIFRGVEKTTHITILQNKAAPCGPRAEGPSRPRAIKASGHMAMPLHTSRTSGLSVNTGLKAGLDSPFRRTYEATGLGRCTSARGSGTQMVPPVAASTPRMDVRASSHQADLASVLLLAIVCIGMFLTAPQHGEFWWSETSSNALDGAFVHDLIRDMPLSDPKGWAVRYYLQYPALSILFYPPLFHVVLGARLFCFRREPFDSG